MKKTIKTLKKFRNTMIAGLCLAVMTGSAVFTGCQMNNMFDETENTLSTASEASETSRNAGDKNLTDSEKIGKIYDKLTAKKPYEYKGEKIAATRLTAEFTKMIPVDDIEDETVKYFAQAGIKALDAGMQALDHMLNDYTFGFYGVATSIFWPEENSVGKETQMILDKIDEVEEQISDMESQMENNFQNLKDLSAYQSDKALLTVRKEKLENLRTAFTNNSKITTYLTGTGVDGINFTNYQQLLAAITGRSYFEGSLPDIVSTSEAFFNLYKESIKNGESYAQICDRYAKALSAWGYEYDKIINGFATEELMETMKLMTIMKAAYCPSFDNKVNYNFNIMTLLSFLNTTGSKIKDDVNDLIYGNIPSASYADYTFEYKGGSVTPDTIKLSKEDSKQLYEYILAYLCTKADFFPENFAEIVMSDNGKITDVKGMNSTEKNTAEAVKIANLKSFMLALEGGLKSWNDLETSYTNYVNQVNVLYEKLTNDKPGYVTCMVPGVKRTFFTTMGYVRYADRLNTFLGCHWNNSGWVNDAFYGKDIQGTYKTNKSFRNNYVRDDLIQNYNCEIYNRDDYGKIIHNSFWYMTESEYEKIYNWYHDGFHKLSKSVPVVYTNTDGTVVNVEKASNAAVIDNPTLTEILYYGAGIGIETKKETVSDNGKTMIKYTPCDTTDKNLGIADAKWDEGASAKPANAKNLFDIGVYYAYDDGKPTSEVADKHDGVGVLFQDDIWFNTWEYRVLGHGLAGNKNGTWNKDFKKNNWLITTIPNDKNLESVEDVLYTYKNCKGYAQFHSNQTYVFPSCVHDMGWNTYWQTHQ